jgi:hypothetical protein
MLNLHEMLMSDGYVGSYGVTWKTPTPEEFETAITGAMTLNSASRENVIAALEAGRGLRWCESSNFYYDHSYGLIGRKRSAAQTETVRCTCGHTVPRAQVMQASLGTACPDCYDRMSD